MNTRDLGVQNVGRTIRRRVVEATYEGPDDDPSNSADIETYWLLLEESASDEEVAALREKLDSEWRQNRIKADAMGGVRPMLNRGPDGTAITRDRFT